MKMLTEIASTPFYFTRNELAFSQEKAKGFYLYRLFKFNQRPNLFIKHGTMTSADMKRRVLWGG